MSEVKCRQVSVAFDGKNGFCVGISADSKTNVRMCWIKSLKKPCDSGETQATLTPRESVGVGVALIQASIIGEAALRNKQLLKNMEDMEGDLEHEKNKKQKK